jgi:CheY-like chemotaxis protein
MATAPDGDAGALRVLIFENDPRQATAYAELFQSAGAEARTALPDQDVQRLCERLQPQVALVDMAIWESDTAYLFGVLNDALGFERPVVIALSILPHQVRRAKRFGADSVWIRGVDDAAGLPQLADDLWQQRRAGKLKPKTPATPL